jgi:hypothetical protein
MFYFQYLSTALSVLFRTRYILILSNVAHTIGTKVQSLEIFKTEKWVKYILSRHIRIRH